MSTTALEAPRHQRVVIVTAVVAEADLLPASKASELPLGIDRAVLEQHKKALLDATLEAASVGSHLLDAIRWVDQQVDVALGNAPPELFL